jgi:hypothetical protein
MNSSGQKNLTDSYASPANGKVRRYQTSPLSTFGKETRVVGDPLPNYKVPGPSHY